MRNQLILVTGASGQLGNAVMRACSEHGIEATGFSRTELDVADKNAVTAVFNGLKPTAVIHCAAYTNVDAAETDRGGAFLVNEQGSRVVAHACAQTGAHLVAVSTDYVFPGNSESGYTENDATGPINVYGESKLAGEYAIREELDERACIARTAWLFSSQPPNFVQTIAHLARSRESIEVVSDQKGNPTWCGHLANALVVCAKEKITGTHHLVDNPPATWHDLAQKVVEELELDCRVLKTTSDAFVRPAARAAFSMLRVTNPDTPKMGDWRDGVRQALMPVPTI